MPKSARDIAAQLAALEEVSARARAGSEAAEAQRKTLLLALHRDTGLAKAPSVAEYGTLARHTVHRSGCSRGCARARQ